MQSTDLINPTPISGPLAYNGTRNTIPESATGSNLASVAEGFPDITMVSPADNGLPPYGQDMNGLLYLASDIKSFLQSGGLITFDQNVSNTIGGYPSGAILAYVDADGIYHLVKSLIDNNTYNFVTTPSYIDGEHWENIPFSAVEWGTIAGTLSNQTDLQAALTALELPSQSGQSGKFLTTNGSVASWGSVDLSSYANTSLSNVTSVAQSFIDTSVGWAMPDYSAGITPTLPYTAPSDGMYVASPQLRADSGATSRIYVNGKQVFYLYNPVNSFISLPYTLLLKKGDVVSASSSYGAAEQDRFFPLKGVV